MSKAVWVQQARGIQVWHFIPQDGRLADHGNGGTEFSPAGNRRYRREAQPQVVAGATFRVKGPPVLCHHGLHGSVRAYDALQYVSSTLLTRAILWGDVRHGTDKSVATHRTVTSTPVDITNILLEWSCLCAEYAFDRLREIRHEPDHRSVAVLGVIRRWYRGEATREELDIATACAADAADAADAACAAYAAYAADAAYTADAAYAAARAACAACAAADAAARAAARAADAAYAADAADAAYAARAAYAAACAAADAAARAADAAAYAARAAAYAARAAAYAAARAALGDKLEALLGEAFA